MGGKSLAQTPHPLYRIHPANSTHLLMPPCRLTHSVKVSAELLGYLAAHVGNCRRGRVNVGADEVGARSRSDDFSTEYASQPVYTVTDLRRNLPK